MAKDLLTILYEPRETMRRIFDSGRARYAIAMIVIACSCSFLTNVIARSRLPVMINGRPLPFLPTPLFYTSIFFFSLLVWIGCSYLAALLIKSIGGVLGGKGTVRGVQAAIAFALVPLIWATIFRVPIALYIRSLHLTNTMSGSDALMAFVHQGGCLVATIALGLRLFMIVLVAFVASNTVGEAMKFSSWRALGTLAICAALPLVVVIAAVLASR